jgi:hypothetical protein
MCCPDSYDTEHMNPRYLEADFVRAEKEEMDKREPFPYSQLPDFISSDLLSRVKEELLDLVHSPLLFIFSLPFTPLTHSPVSPTA